MDDKNKNKMNNSLTKQLLTSLEHQIRDFIKPVYRLNQRYQRQPFGRMTSVHVLDNKEFDKQSR